ncbi:hypothetical protein Cfor_11731, partial [Coptotermes formosanus]
LSRASLMLPALLACLGPLVGAQELPAGSCPPWGPLNYTVLLANPADCSRFFSCSNGRPIEQYCPAGLHFNDILKVCDWPQNVNCVPRCFPLQNDVGGSWTPSSCSAGLSNQGASCKLQCNTNYQLWGSSSVECTDKGWNSTNGNVIPQCQPEECIGEHIEDGLNKTLSGKAGLLFVLDESGSVSPANFQITKDFVKDVVRTFPLSENRSAGVITFDSTAQLKIHLNTDSTSTFLNHVNKIGYRGGGTDILAALRAAITEINNYSKHNLTVVVLITDGVSQTDGTPAADEIKRNGNPLFAIGIDQGTNLVHLEKLASTGDDGIKHFFHVRTYEALENIGKYLN